MALDQINPVPKPVHHGSGLLGAIVGAGAGLLAGVATMNPGIGFAAAGAGSALGGMAGNAIDPDKVPAPQGTVPQINNSATLPQSTALHSMVDHPEMQLATLSSARQALQQDGSLPGPQSDQYMDMFNQAQAKLHQRLGIGI